MDKHTQMLERATRTFEAEGFRGIGVDRLVAAAGVSSRTLYKHFGSRDGLVIAVLEARQRAFMQRLHALDNHPDPLDAMFDALQQWMHSQGSGGCMLLRARSEYAAANPAIVALVQAQKAEFRTWLQTRLQTLTGRPDERLATQLWLLFEGATAAVAVAGPGVIEDARHAARILLEHTGDNP